MSNTSPIPFSAYMERFLFHPKKGYYARLKTIGREGDFVTAPECGPYFADALAEYCAGQLPTWKRPIIMELGAGTGRLAHDLLLGLEKRDVLPERYLIWEKSESLKAVQQDTLVALPKDLFARVEWASNTVGLTGILIANEFFDALPVERFVKTADGLELLGVASRVDLIPPAPLGRELCSQRGDFTCDISRRKLTSRAAEIPPLSALREAKGGRGDQINHFEEVSLNKPFPWQNQIPWQTLPDGYRSEFCPGYAPFLKSILPAFKQGIALIIDYGYTREEYYHPARQNGTLQAYQNHQGVSVFHEPGHCDITAHVDFTHLAECFIAQGWHIDFLKSQAQFLLEQNMLERYPLSVEHYGLKRLLDPRLMGEVFKVMQCTLQ